MSKPVKQMIIDMYRDRFAEVNDAVLVDIRGIEANENNQLRSDLAGKEIRLAVVKNALARQAFKETGLEPLNDMLEGPSAVVYGGDSVVSIARELVDWAKKVEELELKGAVMEGTVFGADEVDRLAKFPTREEAQAEVVQLLVSPAGNIISAATSAGSGIAGVLDAMVEKLENGEEISKVA